MDAAIAEGELTQGQYRVLAFLAEEPTAAAASRLAERLAVSRPTITAVVDGLAGRGLVQRRDDPDDRRRVDHVLTDAGRRALEQADALVARRLAELVRHLEPAEQRAALDDLALWHLALDRARDALLSGEATAGRAP